MSFWDEARERLYAEWKPWWLERHPKEIGEYSWEYLFERGKQIRPRLFCELWRYLCPDRPPCAAFAFIIECAHVISLLLDDLPWMDNATERRGWPTLHRKFSLQKALLLAHDVAELAWEVSQTTPLFREENHKAWAEWAREKAGTLWLGQWLDLSGGGTRYDLAAWKTGTLFETVAEGVALGTGLDPGYWRGWGRALGVLFQWVDDWEDQEEDARMGQRNAFHEDREGTLAEYAELWRGVVQGVGPSWWERPFGTYLWRYFTRVPMDGTVMAKTLFTLSLPPWKDPSHAHLPDRQRDHAGLTFLALFQPYLRGPLPISEAYTADPIHAWDYPESEWMGLLEQVEGLRPFLPTIRQLYRMVQAQEAQEAQRNAVASRHSTEPEQ